MTTTNIHPTAIIEEGAVIGEGCQIGPYCIVKGNVTLGKNNILRSHVVIDGPTEIGDGNEFFEFCSIGNKTQDLKYTCEPTYAKIGSGNTFREYVTVHRGTSPGEYTTIGDNCNLLAHVHVAHNCILGNHIVVSNSTNFAGHVEIDDRAIVGGMVGTHQFCKIGKMAMVGATCKVVQDAMPFMIFDGTPARPRVLNKVGLERNGVSKEEIRNINRAFKIVFKSDLTIDDAVATLEEQFADSECVQEMINFIKKSDRGLAR